jgi:hypothetical protein
VRDLSSTGSRSRNHAFDTRTMVTVRVRPMTRFASRISRLMSGSHRNPALTAMRGRGGRRGLPLERAARNRLSNVCRSSCIRTAVSPTLRRTLCHAVLAESVFVLVPRPAYECGAAASQQKRQCGLTVAVELLCAPHHGNTRRTLATLLCGCMSIQYSDACLSRRTE